MKQQLILALMLVSLTAGAQEYGQGPLAGEADHDGGMGRARLPEATYDGFALGGTWGAKLGLGWARVDWDLGPADGSESLFAPQVSLFYKTTDNFDLNVSALFLSADDTDGALGATEADMTRLALGARYWVDTQSRRIIPYFGGGFGYYLLDGKTNNTREDGVVVPATVSVEDAPGAFFEAGATFQVGDAFFVNADITYDFLIGSADATINDKDEDLDVTALSFNLGVTWMF